jgi:hypothetical protein
MFGIIEEPNGKGGQIIYNDFCKIATGKTPNLLNIQKKVFSGV